MKIIFECNEDEASDLLLARQIFKEKIFVVIVCVNFCAYIRF